MAVAIHSALNAMPARIQTFISSSNEAGSPPRRTRTRAKNRRNYLSAALIRVNFLMSRFYIGIPFMST
jgi:hypothetical protein